MGSLRTLQISDKESRLRDKTIRLIPRELFDVGFILKSQNIYPPHTNFGFHHKYNSEDTISLFLHTIFQSFFLTFDIKGITKLYQRGSYSDPQELEHAVQELLAQWKRLFKRTSYG